MSLKTGVRHNNFSKYYDAIYILFHTGLCISEFCGLTIPDIEVGEMGIKLDHSWVMQTSV